MLYWINLVNFKRQIVAEPLTIAGIDDRKLIIHNTEECVGNKISKKYIISDIKTGTWICKADTKEKAIK